MKRIRNFDDEWMDEEYLEEKENHKERSRNRRRKVKEKYDELGIKPEDD